MTPALNKNLNENTVGNTILSGDLEAYLQSAVQPIANKLDTDSTALFESFRALGDQGWLAPKLPIEMGGLGLSSAEYQQFQSQLARYSGGLAFLQTQHQSAASLLLSNENEGLKQTYLPGMAAGNHQLGVGFSQLRRRPAPMTATAVDDGYRLTGTFPWVTGAGLFTDFVGAAVLPEGTAVFGIVPLTSQTVDEDCWLAVGESMPLAGMAATRTVEVQLKNWFLASEQVLGMRPVGWLEARDRANPLSPLGLIFGCTQAGIDALKVSLKRRGIEHAIAQQLALKLAWLKMDLPRVAALSGEAYPQKIALRGRAISLMNTCAQAAMIAASGAANLASHPTQRIYKESLVFSVSGQTTDGAVASLNSLLSSS